MPHESTMFARRQRFGSVYRCLQGSVHVQLGVTTIALSDEQYLRFVAPANDSAANFELFRQAGGGIDSPHLPV